MTSAPSTEGIPVEFGSCRFRLGEELGSGGFGRVFRCTLRDQQKPYAVKVFDLRRLRLSQHAERDFESLRRETEILRRLPAHPHVVQLTDVVEEANWFFLVLELVSGGDLLASLRALGRRRPCLDEVETSFVARQMVDALSFLHGLRIMHRDLKAENVLVSSTERRGSKSFFHVKITDFGLSKAVGEEFQASSLVGTRKYVAPEVLSATAPYDSRVDLWCFGILLYLLLEGKYPHDQPAFAEQSVLDGAVEKMQAGRTAKAVVSGLLRRDPGRRLGLGELKAHAWLAPPPPRALDDEGLGDVNEVCILSPSSAPVVVIGDDAPTPSGAGLSLAAGLDPSSAAVSMVFPPAAPLRSSASLLMASSADLRSPAAADGLAREESSARMAWAAAEPPEKRPRVGD